MKTDRSIGIIGNNTVLTYTKPKTKLFRKIVCSLLYASRRICIETDS